MSKKIIVAAVFATSLCSCAPREASQYTGGSIEVEKGGMVFIEAVPGFDIPSLATKEEKEARAKFIESCNEVWEVNNRADLHIYYAGAVKNSDGELLSLEAFASKYKVRGKYLCITMSKGAQVGHDHVNSLQQIASCFFSKGAQRVRIVSASGRICGIVYYDESRSFGR